MSNIEKAVEISKLPASRRLTIYTFLFFQAFSGIIIYQYKKNEGFKDGVIAEKNLKILILEKTIKDCDSFRFLEKDKFFEKWDEERRQTIKDYKEANDRLNRIRQTVKKIDKQVQK